MHTGEQLAKKVLLIGWDAADWKFMNPLIDQGLMPALAEMIDNGVAGNITTLRPIYSPMVWNSIATGMLPDKHGILGFIEPDPVSGGARPTSSTSRKVKALWNILHQAGLRSAVTAWFAGHPAEPINGVSVSPVYPHALTASREAWPVPEGSIHPEDLRETFAELRLHPTELDSAALLPFVPRAAEIDQEKDRRLSVLARLLAECCTVHSAATWILEREEWDFMAVCYDSVDHFGHVFARYHPPRMENVSESDFEIYKDVMTGVYRFHDMMLERLLSLAGPDTTVLLVSDHGFHSDHLRPRSPMRHPTDAALWHRPHGVICMQGPHIQRDERIYGASVLDVTPTILTLFGLPVGEDMDGKVLVQAFEDVPAVETIPSWEEVPGDCGMHPADKRTDPVEAQALMEQFVALGYIPPPSDEQSKAAAFAEQESNFNLAQLYLSTRRPMLALPLLEKLVSAKLDPRFAAALCQCRIRLGDHEGARAALSPFLENEKFKPFAEWFLSLTSLQRANPDEAVEHLRQVQDKNPGVPALHVRTGAAFLGLRRWAEAEGDFQKALALDSDNVAAHLGMAMVRLRQQRFEEAAAESLDAVGLEHMTPLGHHLLGVALALRGERERATLAFETALSFAPGMAIAHRWLVRIHSRAGGDIGKASFHRAQLHVLRKDRSARGRGANG